MQEFSRSNNGFKYIITIIDCFSKLAYAFPIKNKGANEVTDVFKNLLKEAVPEKLRTDRGKEFENKLFKSLLDKYKVNFFTSKDDKIKCAIIERFNRSLKSKMFKYFTSKGTRKYIDVLKDLVSAYNNSFHRTIKMKPVDVTNENERDVFFNIYGVSSLRELIKKAHSKSKIKDGDKVRIRYKLNPFDKGYYPNWTDNIFTVNDVLTRHKRPLVKISDESGKKLENRFYPEEVQKIKGDVFRIEKIIKRRNRGGKIEYFVKWLNHPSENNSWVSANDIVTIQNGSE
ncbi:integrase core domain-containing protein-like protein [Dinothrombium tinctorium]|uniref:Integrase core domain-containing protein-like protein n=1 Tax=Dinothrombium tinctorium TaxID=1965070 RepID=A0A443QMG8_9ACAR|nr:integrase core domain-containing protein-like protein [Dinothrombium tinctorium]